jgi:hypothetical protein
MAKTTVRILQFCVADFDALVMRWEKCVDVGGGYIDN